jgi:Rrf2 family nitric oxide-sensitive transcriptional repressor
MQLTLYTDYSLRVLLYLAMHRDRLVTISEVTEAYDVSRNHMVKVVHNLGQLGLIQTIRGKSGGMRLARDPEEIIVGEVVQQTEPHINLLECFDKETNTCPLINACKLKHLLFQARRGFFDVLNQKTLADML